MDQKQYIGKKIRDFRKQSGISARSLGKMLEPPKSEAAVTSWERGRTEPDGNVLIQLCHIFGRDFSDFYYPDRSATQQADQEHPAWIDAPLYGSIAAGVPIEMQNVDDTFVIPWAMYERYPDAFLLKVVGESMNRVIPNGAYALINPTRTTVDGKAYAVCVNGYNATIKRVRTLANGIELYPDSTDPTIKPMVFDYADPDAETVTVIGEVVWYVVPFDYKI